MPQSHIKTIALVGAGGRSGKYIAEALLERNQHKVTAITRPDSTSAMPAGLHAVKKVDYNDHASLVAALQGQEVLVITMSNFAPPESQRQLIDAAAEAGVKWVLPNEWGNDLSKESLTKDSLLGERLLEVRRYIDSVGGGRMRWIGVACSFWYEHSLAGQETRYGFDFARKTLTLIDDGRTQINTTTFAQVGRAVASLLSLKEYPENEHDTSPNLSQFANSSVYISSFLLSQRDMLDSVLRVTGEKEADWTISHEDSKERYERALGMWKEGGKVEGLVTLLYTRVFYPDGSGDFSDKLHNEVLGLPEEDLDAATRVAVELAKAGGTHYT